MAATLCVLLIKSLSVQPVLLPWRLGQKTTGWCSPCWCSGGKLTDSVDPGFFAFWSEAVWHVPLLRDAGEKRVAEYQNQARIYQSSYRGKAFLLLPGTTQWPIGEGSAHGTVDCMIVT